MFTFPDGTPAEVEALATPEVNEAARLEQMQILKEGVENHLTEPEHPNGIGRLMIVLEPSGTTHLLHLDDNEHRTYDLLRSAVEGLIEFVPITAQVMTDSSAPTCLVVNEEFTYTTGTDGRRLPLNLFASTLAGQPIFGTVVITHADPDDEGATQGLDSVSASAIRWVLSLMFPVATFDGVPVAARTHRLQPDDSAAGITAEPWLTLEELLQG